MPVAVVCPCGAKVRAADSFAGRTICCPKCGAALPVPDGPVEPVVAAEVAPGALLPALGVNIGDPPGIDGRPARRPDPKKPARRKVKRGVAPAALFAATGAGLAAVALWVVTRPKPEAVTPGVEQTRPDALAVEPLPGLKPLPNSPPRTRPMVRADTRAFQEKLADPDLSPARRVAMVESATIVDQDDPLIAEARSLIVRASTIYVQNHHEIAGYAVATSHLATKDGTIVGPMNVLRALALHVPPPSTGRPTRDIKEWAIAYVGFRKRPANHEDACILMEQLAKVVGDR